MACSAWRLGAGQVLVLTLSRLAKILFCLAIKYLDQSKLAVLKQLTGQDKTAEGKKRISSRLTANAPAQVPAPRLSEEPSCELISLPLEGKVSAEG